jgi:hypothetical protein
MFTYTVSDKTSTSKPGIVWIVPPHGNIVFSDFSTSIDGWSIVGNGERAKALAAGGLTYEPYSRGVLNHYVLGTDAEIDTDRLTNNDSPSSQWYFLAPSKFLGYHIIAYGGSLSFSIASAAGACVCSSGCVWGVAVALSCRAVPRRAVPGVGAHVAALLLPCRRLC